MMRGIEYHYPEAAYFADPCEVPSLSQSIAKILVNESELHAFREHPRLGGHVRTRTKAMDVGTICHAIMLGQPLPEIELIPYDDYRNKDAQALKRLAIDCGKIPLTNKEHGEQGKLMQAALTIRSKLAERGVTFSVDHCEVAMFWTINGVQCKARIDNIEGPHSVDLKFTECAHPDFIDRQVETMGYNIQEAAYTEAINELVPEAAGQGTFSLLFCETSPPYCITPARMSPEASMIGMLKWKYAQRRWAECLQSNQWNEYVAPGQCHIVPGKPWALQQAMERYGTPGGILNGS